jgi:hypothetical protein
VENAEKFAVTVSEAKKAKVNVAILFTERCVGDVQNVLSKTVYSAAALYRESTAALYKSLSHSFEDSISFVEVPAGYKLERAEMIYGNQ